MSNLATLSQFRLVGQLESFIIKDSDKIKYLRIKVDEREYWLKIPKKLRQDIDLNLSPGTWLEVTGNRELKKKTGVFKLKAQRINLLSNPDIPCAVIIPETQASETGKTGKILVCQKSSCWKRGGQQLCEALTEKIEQEGLSDRIEVKLTGCLKQCKKGPNMVCLPDKTRYSHAQPNQVDQLLAKHFTP